MLSKDADIIPNLSLGGCQLRTPLREIQQSLMGLGLYRPGSYEMCSLFEASYLIEDFAIRIYVDVRNGKIFKVCALECYTGTLFSNIRVGMLAGEVMKIDDRIYYDEFAELLYFRGCEGIALDIGGEDPPPDLVPELPVRAICVFAAEAFTTEAHDGCW